VVKVRTCVLFCLLFVSSRAGTRITFYSFRSSSEGIIGEVATIARRMTVLYLGFCETSNHFATTESSHSSLHPNFQTKPSPTSPPPSCTDSSPASSSSSLLRLPTTLLRSVSHLPTRSCPLPLAPPPRRVLLPLPHNRRLP